MQKKKKKKDGGGSVTGHGTLLDTDTDHGTIRSFTAAVGALSGDRGRTLRRRHRVSGACNSSGSGSVHAAERTAGGHAAAAAAAGSERVDGIDVRRLVEGQVDTAALSAVQRCGRCYERWVVVGHSRCAAAAAAHVSCCASARIQV